MTRKKMGNKEKELIAKIEKIDSEIHELIVESIKLKTELENVRLDFDYYYVGFCEIQNLFVPISTSTFDVEKSNKLTESGNLFETQGEALVIAESFNNRLMWKGENGEK